MPRYGHILDVQIGELSGLAIRTAFSLTFVAAGDQAAWTPSSGKAVRIKLISFENSADVQVGWRFGITENVQTCRTTKGPYVANFVGCNVQGAVDEVLNIRAEGAVVVKGYILGKEV